jgi:hypothetical protein
MDALAATYGENGTRKGSPDKIVAGSALDQVSFSFGSAKIIATDSRGQWVSQVMCGGSSSPAEFEEIKKGR